MTEPTSPAEGKAGLGDPSETEPLIIFPGATIRHSDAWIESGVQYANAEELVRLGRNAHGSIVPESRLARMLITTEKRTTSTDAIKRLQEIGSSREASAHFYAIAGWPAVEIQFEEPLPQRDARGNEEGDEDIRGPAPIVKRAIVAIAVDSELVQFDISLAPDVGQAILVEAIQIARSFDFPTKDSPEDLRRALEDLRKGVYLRPFEFAGVSDQPPVRGAAVVGAPVGVEPRAGQGELEVAADANAQTIVIASNVGLDRSINQGNSFASANPGQFGAPNDPTVTRAFSGNFYLGTIAFPSGTPQQLNVAGCTNAVSRSVNNGADFDLQGYSARCPTSGFGTCFPDQPHIAGDTFTSGPAGAVFDQLYAVWRNFTPVGNAPPSCTRIRQGFVTTSISCSQDNGVNWTLPAVVQGAGDHPRVSVGQDGRVYVVSSNGKQILVHRFASCANGLTLDPVFPVVPAANIVEPPCPMPGLDRCDGNLLASPTIAPDPADPNHIFLTFARNDGSAGDQVITLESSNRGESFSHCSQVNGGPSARRFMPWSCSVNGLSYAGWYDRRAATIIGALDDLTEYYVGSAGFTSDLNLSNNPDPQCASGWPFGVDNPNDSESCTVQPQAAGFCLTSMGTGSNQRCDFSTPNCPSGETCRGGPGAPKYGDYNGITCAANRVIAAWASATAPQGLPTATSIGIYSSVVLMNGSAFDRIDLVLTTGNDNATSGLEIIASLSGQPAALCLKPSTDLPPDGICPNGGGAKDQNGKDTWDNWSVSPLSFALPAPQATLGGFATITITTRQNCSGFNCDNWDLQGVTARVSDSKGILRPATLLDISNARDKNNNDNCIARLKALPNLNSVTYDLSSCFPRRSFQSAFGQTPPGSCPQ
jgi:hypothetical protein